MGAAGFLGVAQGLLLALLSASTATQPTYPDHDILQFRKDASFNDSCPPIGPGAMASWSAHTISRHRLSVRTGQKLRIDCFIVPLRRSSIKKVRLQLATQAIWWYPSNGTQVTVRFRDGSTLQLRFNEKRGGTAVLEWDSSSRLLGEFCFSFSVYNERYRIDSPKGCVLSDSNTQSETAVCTDSIGRNPPLFDAFPSVFFYYGEDPEVFFLSDENPLRTIISKNLVKYLFKWNRRENALSIQFSKRERPKQVLVGPKKERNFFVYISAGDNSGDFSFKLTTQNSDNHRSERYIVMKRLPQPKVSCNTSNGPNATIIAKCKLHNARSFSGLTVLGTFKELFRMSRNKIDTNGEAVHRFGRYVCLFPELFNDLSVKVTVHQNVSKAFINSKLLTIGPPVKVKIPLDICKTLLKTTPAPPKPVAQFPPAKFFVFHRQQGSFQLVIARNASRLPVRKLRRAIEEYKRSGTVVPTFTMYSYRGRLDSGRTVLGVYTGNIFAIYFWHLDFEDENGRFYNRSIRGNGMSQMSHYELHDNQPPMPVTTHRPHVIILS